jgi:conjugal transfer pilus assembly protein TraE
MKHSLSLAKAGHLLKQRNALSALTAGLLISNILLVLFCFTRSERIIMIPPEVKQSFWVEHGQVSNSYLEEMSSFFLHLALDRSPESIDFQNQVLLRYASPHAYGSLKSQLLEDEKRLKQERLSTHFHAHKIIVDQKNLTAKVEGTLHKFVGGAAIGTLPVQYNLRFSYTKGKLFIENLSEDIKNEAP